QGLFCELLMGARRFGLVDEIRAQYEESFPGLLDKVAGSIVGLRIHAGRRAADRSGLGERRAPGRPRRDPRAFLSKGPAAGEGGRAALDPARFSRTSERCGVARGERISTAIFFEWVRSRRACKPSTMS